MPASFIHLRVHSEYSIRDGIVRIKPLIETVIKSKMPAVAVNDDNNLFALVKFYQAAQELGVKPLVSVDVMVTSNEATESPSPFVLFALNEIGYKKLSQLLSKSYIEGKGDQYLHLKRDWIPDYAEGLLALSGGKDGEVGRALLGRKDEYAARLVREWMEIFPDAYYLELHRTGREGEEDYNAAAVDLALALDCPVVATNQVRFLAEEEYEAHEARVCIHEGTTLDDPRREKRYSQEQYLKTPEQMVELFEDIPEAIENTIEIARRCNVDLDLSLIHI